MFRDTKSDKGKTAQTVFGIQGSGPGELEHPSHVAVSPVSGNIVIVDRGNNRVQIFNNSGEFVSQFGSKGSNHGQFYFGAFPNAGGVTVTRQGHIAVADTANHRIQLFTEDGKHIKSMGSEGSQRGYFEFPRGLSFHQNQIYVCDRNNRRVQVLTQEGTVAKVITTGDWEPRDIAVCSNGDIIVVGCDDIRVYNTHGKHKSLVFGRVDNRVNSSHTKAKNKATPEVEESDPLKFAVPWGVAIDNKGHVVVTDASSHQVHVLEQSGKLIRTFGSRGDKPGQLKFPVGVAAAMDGSIVVVDWDNHRIQKFRFN